MPRYAVFRLTGKCLSLPGLAPRWITQTLRGRSQQEASRERKTAEPRPQVGLALSKAPPFEGDLLGCAMLGLERLGADLGLTAEEVEQALSLGRPTQDLAWYEGRDLRGRAQKAAQELFETERILEYQCYDADWHAQGRGVIALQDWADRDQFLFLGLHGPASDKDYQYFVAKEMGSSNGIYHICDCDASRCKVRNTRGDR